MSASPTPQQVIGNTVAADSDTPTKPTCSSQRIKKFCFLFGPPVLLTVIGVFAFTGVYFALRAQEDAFLSSRFDGLVQERYAALRGEVRVVLSELRSMGALHTVSGPLNGALIRQYANVTGIIQANSPAAVDKDALTSALVNIAFAQTIYHEQRDEYERAKNYSIFEFLGGRKVRVSNASRYIPYEYGTNALTDSVVTGADLLRLPTTKNLVPLTVQTGGAVTEFPVQQAVSKLWLTTVMIGMYGRNNSALPPTPEERNASLAGLVFAQVNYSHLFELALRRVSDQVPVNIRLAFGDVAAARFLEPQPPFNASSPPVPFLNASFLPILASRLPATHSRILETRTATLDIAGIPHTMHFQLPEDAVPKLIPRIFDSDMKADAYFFASWVLLMFLLLALVAWWLARQSLNRYQRIEDEVDRQTKALQQAIHVANDLRVAAEASNASKTKFLAYLCHELRNPLQSIVYSTDLFDDKQLSAGSFSGNVRTASSLMRLILRDVLDLTEIETGAIALEQNPLDLREVIQREAKHVAKRNMLSSADVVPSFVVDSSVPETVVGDEKRLRQLINILLSNSCKFTTKGVIECRVRVLDAHEALAHQHEIVDSRVFVDSSSFTWNCDGERQPLLSDVIVDNHPLHEPRQDRPLKGTAGVAESAELDTSGLDVELKEIASDRRAALSSSNLQRNTSDAAVLDSALVPSANAAEVTIALLDDGGKVTDRFRLPFAFVTYFVYALTSCMLTVLQCLTIQMVSVLRARMCLLLPLRVRIRAQQHC